MDYLLEIIPELKNTIGFKQNHPHHHLTVFDHIVLAITKSEKNFDVRLSLLLHDIGKPFSYQDDSNGIRHFKYHAEKSAEMAEIILKRLNFEDSYIEKIVYLITNHDLIINVETINKENLELEKLRLMIQYADAKAHAPDKIDQRIVILDEISIAIQNLNK